MKLLKIGDFLSSLPSSIISGDDIIIPDAFFRKMFSFSGLNRDDTFYHLGIGNNYSSLLIAKKEYGVKKAVGIDINPDMVDLIKSKIDLTNEDINIINEDVIKSSLSEATVIF
jgi:predicted RNA methylase